MTGDQPGDGIGAHRLADRPGRTGPADGIGQVAVGTHRTRRNPQQRPPHADLEVAAAHQQRQRPVVGAGLLEQARGSRRGRLRCMHQFCRRPLAAQFRQRHRRILVAEAQPAHATFGDRHQHLSERPLVVAIGDRQPTAAAAVLARGHGLQRHEVIVQPPRTGQSTVQAGVQHAARCVQQPLGVGHGEALEEALGRDAGPAPEQTLAVERAQIQRRGQFRQRGLARAVLLQEADGAGDARVVGRHEGILGRLGDGQPIRPGRGRRPDSCGLSPDPALPGAGPAVRRAGSCRWWSAVVRR